MDRKEKIIAKQLLGQCIQQLIDDVRNGKRVGKIDSLRKLAAASGVEYAIIQRITSGKKDPQFTTLLALATAFDMSPSEMLAAYGKSGPKTRTKTPG